MCFLIKHPLIYSPYYHPKLRRWNAVIREFGIRETRYANYRIAVVGDIAIRFLSNLAQKASSLILNSRKFLGFWDCVFFNF